MMSTLTAHRVGYCEWSYLRSEGGVLSVPFACIILMQERTFCVNGPSVWNDLPLELRFLSWTLIETFYNRLQIVLFSVLESGAHLGSKELEEAPKKLFLNQ